MNIQKLFNLKKTAGEIGIEIEVEGDDLAMGTDLWRKEADGSLQGNSAEYVLRKPALRGAVDTVLHELMMAFEDEGSDIYDSPRTGVHVHVNVQELTMPEVFSFLVVYGVFEEMLMRYCGEGRVGNLFCMSMKDAEYLPYWIRQCCPKDQWQNLPEADIRYSAINLNALSKYGSLEFRAMRGTVEKKLISNWASILLCIKDFSKEINNPEDIIAMVSQQGEKGFAQQVFGDLLDQVWTKDWSDSICEGMRRMQPIACEVEIPVIRKKLNRAKPVVVENQEIQDIMQQFNAHMQGR